LARPGGVLQARWTAGQLHGRGHAARARIVRAPGLAQPDRPRPGTLRERKTARRAEHGNKSPTSPAHRSPLINATQTRNVAPWQMYRVRNLTGTETRPG